MRLALSRTLAGVRTEVGWPAARAYEPREGVAFANCRWWSADLPQSFFLTLLDLPGFRRRLSRRDSVQGESAARVGQSSLPAVRPCPALLRPERLPVRCAALRRGPPPLPASIWQAVGCHVVARPLASLQRRGLKRGSAWGIILKPAGACVKRVLDGLSIFIFTVAGFARIWVGSEVWRLQLLRIEH